MIALSARRLAGLVAVATVAVSVLTVPRPAFADPTTGAISGVITRPDGSPAGGEQIFVQRFSPDLVYRSATSDATGAYTVPDLPAGDGYQVGVQRQPGPQYAHGTTDLGVPSGSPSRRAAPPPSTSGCCRSAPST